MLTRLRRSMWTSVPRTPDCGPRHAAAGQIIQGREAAFELFVAQEQFAEAVEPAVADLDDPAMGLLLRAAPFAVSLPASIDDMGDVAVLRDDVEIAGAAVTGVGAQVLAAPPRRTRALDDDGAEHRSGGWVAQT